MVGDLPVQNQLDLDNILAAIGSGPRSSTVTFVPDVEGSDTVSEYGDQDPVIKPEPVLMTPTKGTEPGDAEEFS